MLGIEEEEFEALTAVIMKNSVFCDISLCSSLNVNWHVGGTCRLHLQGQRISHAGNQCESRWQFLAWLIPWPWKWRWHVPQKRLLTFSGRYNSSRRRRRRMPSIQQINMFKRCPSNRPWSPIGSWDIEAPTFSRQLAHRWWGGCQHYAPTALYLQEDF
jgi:hypothetical protein